VGPKHVEIQQYTNKIVTSVGFHSICWKDARYKKLKIWQRYCWPQIIRITGFRSTEGRLIALYYLLYCVWWSCRAKANAIALPCMYS